MDTPQNLQELKQVLLNQYRTLALALVVHSFQDHQWITHTGLARRVEEQDSDVWLLNTGWTGGPYGTGNRFKLEWTRAFVTAILDGSLAQSEFVEHDIFGLHIPTTAPNVPSEVLDP